VSTLKRQYRDLSRKYHPDKNPETDTTAKFMGLKTAYEILGDPERRILYDVYGQTDFSQDDRMKSMIEQRFKNATEQEQQYESYKKSQSGMKVFGEVMPYYFTWFLLSVYRVERSTTCYYVMMGMIALVCYFEIQVRLQYGTGHYDMIFKLMYDYFPKHLTIGENMRLTRELFPLLF
jgi:curved DNA-binding protein CbpA